MNTKTISFWMIATLLVATIGPFASATTNTTIYQTPSTFTKAPTRTLVPTTPPVPTCALGELHITDIATGTIYCGFIGNTYNTVPNHCTDADGFNPENFVVMTIDHQGSTTYVGEYSNGLYVLEAACPGQYHVEGFTDQMESHTAITAWVLET